MLQIRYRYQGITSSRVFQRVGAFLTAVFVALSYGCLPRAFYMASGSMEPTWESHDRIFVSEGLYKTQTPERGDIVVFQAPDTIFPTNSGNTSLVFRIIGLPGETLEIYEGNTLIDRVAIQEPYIKEAPTYTYGPIAVPADAYIVLGDNRNNAFDGHAWGFVPRENLIGKVQSIYWPLGRYGSVYQE